MTITLPTKNFLSRKRHSSLGYHKTLNILLTPTIFKNEENAKHFQSDKNGTGRETERERETETETRDRERRHARVSFLFALSLSLSLLLLRDGELCSDDEATETTPL